jgi:hypothetical protein
VAETAALSFGWQFAVAPDPHLRIAGQDFGPEPWTIDAGGIAIRSGPVGPGRLVAIPWRKVPVMDRTGDPVTRVVGMTFFAFRTGQVPDSDRWRADLQAWRG